MINNEYNSIAENFTFSIRIYEDEINNGIILNNIFYKCSKIDNNNIAIKYYIVFSDEIHPDSRWDWFYRKLRPWLYGSLKDICPLIAIYRKNLNKISHIGYENASGQLYDETYPDHSHISFEEVQKFKDCKPNKQLRDNEFELVAATWNHLFLNCYDFNKNDVLDKKKWISFTPEVKSLPNKYKKTEKFNRRFSNFHLTDPLTGTIVTATIKSFITLKKEQFKEFLIPELFSQVPNIIKSGQQESLKIDPIQYGSLKKLIDDFNIKTLQDLNNLKLSSVENKYQLNIPDLQRSIAKKIDNIRAKYLIDDLNP